MGGSLISSFACINSFPGSWRCQRHLKGSQFTSIRASGGINQGFKKIIQELEMGIPVGGLGTKLLYKPYMDYLCMALLDSDPNFQPTPLATNLHICRSDKGMNGAVVHNWTFMASRLRRIRMTYFDAASSGQAFNALLYPDYRFELPMLGIDLLSFGKKKILFIVDFIPLSQEAQYLEKHTRKLEPIRKQIVDKCGQMSTRYFQENLFFSKQLIFYRSSNGTTDPVLQAPEGQLFKTYTEYVDTYLSLLHDMKEDNDKNSTSLVKDRQDAYDQYLAERDPAIEYLNSYFGEQWGHSFLKDFLCPGAFLKDSIIGPDSSVDPG